MFDSRGNRKETAMARYFIIPDCWKQWGNSSDWRDYIISDAELDEYLNNWKGDKGYETLEKSREALRKTLVEVGADFDAIEEGYVEEEYES